MIQTFLTGHPVAGLRAQGVRGLPVTDYSEQIHALLCLRGMHKIADCFAVPLRSRPQHELQWYSPLRGVVIRWSEADIQQKQRALLMLEQAYAAIEQLSELCQAAKTPAGVFFARLLEKMDSFPGKKRFTWSTMIRSLLSGATARPIVRFPGVRLQRGYRQPCHHSQNP